MAANGTNLTGQVHFRNYEPWYGYIFAGLYIVVIIVALFGNVLVCFCIAISTKLRRSPTTLFIFSLAVSDLITVSISMPFDAEILITSGVWFHGEIMCKAWTVAYLLTVPTSILTLLAVSIDRYKTLSDPLNRFRRTRFMTRKKAVIVIVAIWVYCFIIAILPIAGIINQLSFVDGNQCFFPMPPLFNTINNFVNFVFPILLTCCIYLKIYQIAKLQPLHHQKFSGGPCGRPKMQKDYLRNIRAAKTTSMFVCAFMFCWIPYCTISIVSNLGSDAFFYSIPPHVFPPLLMLGYLNSALNPFLFSFRNRAFKSTCSRIYNALKRKKSSHGASRSIHSTGKRSEIPETDSGTAVRMFSMRSLSQSDPTPDSSNPVDSLQKCNLNDTCGSREPLSDNDRLAHTMNCSLEIDIDIAASYNNTYL